jgi:hypothetical protein
MRVKQSTVREGFPTAKVGVPRWLCQRGGGSARPSIKLAAALAIVACEAGAGGDTGFAGTMSATDASMSGTDPTGEEEGDTEAEDEESTASSGGSEGESSNDTDMPMPGTDHALGTIVLGETHPVATPSEAFVVLNATFIPDASITSQSCGADIDGCTVTVPLDCMPTVCTADQVCAWDDNCMPTCQAACNLACAADEVCYFPFPDAPACRKVEAFDAGRLDFLGTLEPIELYPPYALPPDIPGPVALPDREITVSSSGATQAGFAPFEAATTSMDSVFSTIDDILPAEAFGTADLTIDWIPGQDDMTIAITVTGSLGTSGTVTCEADDAMGTFDVPRAALDAAIPGDTPSSYSLSLQRSHTETTMDLETRGALLDHMVQPVGWIDFVYTSIETGTITNL